MVGIRGGVLLASLLLLAGCQRERGDNLRDAYERMLAQAERRAAEAASRDTPAVAEPAPGPAALPIDTLPAAARPAAPAPTDTTPSPAAPPPGPVEERERPGIAPVVLRDVRSAAHQGFDRVVFEFDGATPPGYRIEPAARPVRECGSGEAVQVAGDQVLRVRFEPARAHEFVGETARATVTNRSRTLDHPVLRQLTLICDFEAQVEWALGLASPEGAAARPRYRALELSEPARLVIDLLH
jgi:hypothetical protein